MKLHKIVLLCILILVLIAMDFSEARGRSGGRSGSSSRSRGSSRNSGGSSRSRSSRGSNTAYKAKKVTKYTPIKATSARSPVIGTQATKGLRSSTFTKVFVGYMLARYAFGSAPVYRYGYPMYRSYVTIPENRAVRLTFEERKLLDADGNLCVNKTRKEEEQTLLEGIDEHLVELNTAIVYKETGKVKRFEGIDKTVSLEDIEKEDFALMSNARYNMTIVNGTNCTQIEKKVNGTMVAMYQTNPNYQTNADYQTNPNNAGMLYISYKLLLAGIALLGFLNM